MTAMLSWVVRGLLIAALCWIGTTVPPSQAQEPVEYPAWPVAGTAPSDITHTFGPRRLGQRYDWHRGIDIAAPIGTPVLATWHGVLFDLQRYPDGGRTVILRHTFPEPITWQGSAPAPRTLMYFYTFYMHLDSYDPLIQRAHEQGRTARENPDDPVLQHPVPLGTQIGQVGKDDAVTSHLHWEVRIGTPYSLAWQLANPTSRYGANSFGFDPHVHPMGYTVATSTTLMDLLQNQTPDRPVFQDAVWLTSRWRESEPNLNRVQVDIHRVADSARMASHVLDLNLRTGFDASSTQSLDRFDPTKPFLYPRRDAFGLLYYEIDIVIPREFSSGFRGPGYVTTVTVSDIWGRSISRTVSYAP